MRDWSRRVREAWKARQVGGIDASRRYDAGDLGRAERNRDGPCLKVCVAQRRRAGENMTVGRRGCIASDVAR